MKIIAILLMALLAVGCQAQKPAARVKWQPLFNGQDLNYWQVKITGRALNDNYGQTFRVQNGMLQVRYDQYQNFNEQYGHIFYKQPFSYYLLAVEYRFSGQQVAGGPGWALRNSGAMLHCQAPGTMGLKQDFPISIEVQLLGGNGQDERHTANLCTPGTNVVIDNKLVTNHCVDSKSQTYHGDQWVRVEMLVLGDSVMQHFVNGEPVLRYEKPQVGGGNVIFFDPAQKQDGKLLKEGYISLQSESHPVDFRRVELVNLQPYARDTEKLTRVVEQLLSEKRVAK
ncbi:MAG: FIG01094042: hypothetical protein [uncultured Adhaeribacter sp.]|uniref:3-keto-alpha-glucoside-1,2-lyase/3-keto-2-hydroxy-glucal hydratase domain-containing protein n=1 Tax=uncultured Adhaeribacter sp. TaxID=448109 RepID=A0A6J4J946_9BACT|nr:MAG: FIG01094042: hypothetical protein [uncultured Adhaeribacter sp.]